MGVNSQLHATANLAPGKEALVPTEQKPGWASRAGWDALEKRKNVLSHAEIRATIPQMSRPQSSQNTNYIIPPP
jgi:hypothetical protein